MCEVFTDKLVAKIPSTAAGKVIALNYEIDDMPQTGHVLMQIDDGEDGEAEPAKPDYSTSSSDSSSDEGQKTVASA